MFDVGDEVVCIDDQPMVIKITGATTEVYPLPFSKGDIFIVVAAYPTGYRFECEAGMVTCSEPCVGIKEECPLIGDVWASQRFCKVIKLDTQESLSELIKLADTTPAKPETVDA